MAAAVLAALLLIPFEFEVPIDVAEKEGGFLHVSYWDNAIPKVRLELSVDHRSKSLSVRAYKCYAIYWWFRPHLQKSAVLPGGTQDYDVRIPTPDSGRFDY